MIALLNFIQFSTLVHICPHYYTLFRKSTHCTPLHIFLHTFEQLCTQMQKTAKSLQAVANLPPGRDLTLNPSDCLHFLAQSPNSIFNRLSYLVIWDQKKEEEAVCRSTYSSSCFSPCNISSFIFAPLSLFFPLLLVVLVGALVILCLKLMPVVFGNSLFGQCDSLASVVW